MLLHDCCLSGLGGVLGKASGIVTHNFNVSSSQEEATKEGLEVLAYCCCHCSWLVGWLVVVDVLVLLDFVWVDARFVFGDVTQDYELRMKITNCTTTSRLSCRGGCCLILDGAVPFAGSSNEPYFFVGLINELLVGESCTTLLHNV